MPELILHASDDLVARLASENDPLRAVVELVWNSIDAEAWTVNVTMERDPEWDGILAVHVEDDGHGISVDDVGTSFGRIGGSWKLHAMRSKNDVRGIHGSKGEGRLRAFALGSRVRWRSTSADTAGNLHEVTITGRRSNRTVFQWNSEPLDDGTAGTTFTAFNDEQRSLGALTSDGAIHVVQAPFAPVLLNNKTKLKISYDGVLLDPAKEIVSDATLGGVIESSDGSHSEVSVRIIEWRQGIHRMIYYGPDSEHFTFEENGSQTEGHFSYSAYVTWPGLTDQAGYLQLGELAPEPLNEVWRLAHDIVRSHFAMRRRERRREQVQRWKETGIYPYQGEAVSEPEQAERALFDVVSGTLSPQIPRNVPAARLTLALLRDAIRHDPGKLTTILHEVVALKPEDREGLTRLLSETTLPAIIKSTNIVANRNKFLLALEHLLFDPQDSLTVGERDHLHPVLEGELWIFGEGYNMMNSERGLTQLLRTHLRLTGLPEKNVKPVLRWDGKKGRVDLHLAALAREHDRIRHLIVELKAPNIVIGRKELDQVEDYGNAIVANSHFQSPTSQWDIVLIGTQLDTVATNKIHPEAKALGRFWAPDQVDGGPLVRCYVRRWRDVLNENKRRLDFMTSVLQHNPSIAEGLEFVRERYSDVLPDSLANPDDDSSEGAA
jgi:Histidine kinase-, DNA gyrase B-, and HSP90-like ATPase